MTITELAISVCLTFNNLPCDTIGVRTDKSLRTTELARTAIFNNKRIEILVQPHISKTKNTHLTRAVLVHEFSHVQLWLSGDINNIHGPKFRRLCTQQSKILGVNMRRLCFSY